MADTRHLGTDTVAGAGCVLAVIAIAHRLATVTRADRIRYLETGRILEAGARGSPLRPQGGYAAMRRRQALGSETTEEAGLRAWDRRPERFGNGSYSTVYLRLRRDGSGWPAAFPGKG